MSSNDLEYLVEVVKIVNSALGDDRERMVKCVLHLSDLLEREGHSRLARQFRAATEKGSNRRLAKTAMVTAPAPHDPESRMPLADDEVILHPIRLYLSGSVQQQSDSFVEYIQQSHLLATHDVEISPSLLLYGPPGCGKTQLARQIAQRLDLPILTARSDSLISSFLGKTAKNIRSLCDYAASRPCVLFLDEFDALAKRRDDAHELGELKRVAVSLLQTIDSIAGRVVLVAATNHEHLLDMAIWRRFAYKIKLDVPDKVMRSKILTAALTHYSSKKDIEFLINHCEGWSGADLVEIANEIKRTAIMSGTEVATARMIYGAFSNHYLNGSESSKIERIAQFVELYPDVSSRKVAEIFDTSQSTVSRISRAKS